MMVPTLEEHSLHRNEKMKGFRVRKVLLRFFSKVAVLQFKLSCLRIVNFLGLLSIQALHLVLINMMIFFILKQESPI